MNPIKSRQITALIIGFLGLSNGLMALPTDNQKPLHIHSEQFNYQGHKRIATYHGQVYSTQGSRRLHADKLILVTDSNDQIKTITAYGNPCHFSYLPQKGKKRVTGVAKIIIYQPKKDLIILKHDAKINNNNNILKGPVILYNTVTEAITAPSTEEGRA